MPKFRALNCSKRSVRFQVLAPCSAAASQEDLQGEYFQFSSCIPSVFIIITPRAGNTGQIPIRLSEENNITIITIIGRRHGLDQPCSPRLQSKLPDVAQRAAELQSSEFTPDSMVRASPGLEVYGEAGCRFQSFILQLQHLMSHKCNRVQKSSWASFHWFF